MIRHDWWLKRICVLLINSNYYYFLTNVHQIGIEYSRKLRTMPLEVRKNQIV